MLNQVILLGRISSTESMIVDNGTHAISIVVKVEDNEVPVLYRDPIPFPIGEGDMVGIKAHVHMIGDTVTLVGSRITMVSPLKNA